MITWVQLPRVAPKSSEISLIKIQSHPIAVLLRALLDSLELDSIQLLLSVIMLRSILVQHLESQGSNGVAVEMENIRFRRHRILTLREERRLC